MTIAEQAAGARRAARILATQSHDQRSAAMEAMAQALEAQQDAVLRANCEDVQNAKRAVDGGELDAPLLKRLDLAGKYDDVVSMIRSVARQADPLGKTECATELADQLDLFRVSVPIGVIGVIFESRPDALVQIAALCLKSGNAVLLKGGREAIESNRALATVMHDAAVAAGAPEGWLVLLETREDVSAILGLDRDIDLIIPRGSNEFVRYIMENTNIAVMGHADGICHVFVETEADADKSVRICVDAKTQYVSVCNAAETILIDRAALAEIGPKLLRALDDAGVEIRGDVEIQALAGGIAITPAVEDDWRAEYLDYVVAIRVVAGMAEAVDHINEYGSHHTDAIVTENAAQAAAFIAAVDSSSVVHNASTRFADGFRYGLGAEVGISTNRLHSRGPVGLEGLCSYKYVLLGDGHTVDDFESGVRSFTHRPLDRTYYPGS